ncbi:T9SS type A sorting domain-containing protein [Hymenobacter jeollabukensis]|uniref:T9SS type A sorting domain-containing protein n=1 Tax=Hymenobacter jeollabukensis TaxID=2025313 RepID=A0A5R8WI72_9BACT|nr:T9SS type A sorting domain-containing protein [Hymenobacter jeollabukensis]TLM88549.1 T9SS type A sorting domain-containing protein [Hymenobacter jeollabukensis]
MLSSNRITRRGAWRGLALLGLLALTGTAASAQTLSYTVPLVQNVPGTYTDLAATGTAISTTSTDDANSAAQNIGFTFSYNGQSFQQFILNTNGALKLGTTAPSSAALYSTENQPSLDGPANSINAADVNLLMPFNFDLEAGNGTGGAEYRVATTGTAPNRVCTIQWKNVSDKAGATPKHYANFSFQVKLYETTSVIEFVYGTATATTAPASAAPHWATAGLKGSGPLAGQLLLVSHASVNPWSTMTYKNEPYVPTTSTANGDNALNFRSTVLPDAGRTLRFVPQYANDIEVQLVYSMTKIPLSGGGGQVVSAIFRNVGTATQTLIPVTLNVSGANTYSNLKSIGTLAAGASATVTFDPYTPTALGTNTVTVSLLSDDNGSNNTKTVTQQVTDNLLSYANSNTATSLVGIQPANATGAFLTKYNTTATRTLTGANIFLGSSTTPANTSVGRTVFAVALNSTGTVIARSADYVIQATDVDAYKPFTFTTPVSVTAGSFYVGIGVVNPTGSAIFYPASFQPENPTRTGTFYIVAPLNATGANAPSDLSAQNYGILLMDAVLNTTTGVSKALESAISVYPNPSNGEFTLAVRGANAISGLQVEVTNLLGQRVYTSSVRDNFENKLNLSHLANGLYTLKVNDGGQYTMRTISISK